MCRSHMRHPADSHQTYTANLCIFCQVQQRVQLVTPADVLRLNPVQVGAIVMSCLVCLPSRLVQLGLQGPGPGCYASAEGHTQLRVRHATAAASASRTLAFNCSAQGIQWCVFQ